MIVNAGIYSTGNKTFYKDTTTNIWYEEVEYLKGDGNAYIDTLLKRKSTFKYDFKFQIDVKSAITYTNIFGCDERESGNNYKFYVYTINASNYVIFADSSSYQKFDIALQVNTPYVYNLENGKSVVNGTSYTGGSMIDALSNTDCIFWTRISKPANQDKLNGKFYYYKVKDGDELIRDLVPVKQVNVNTYGMFDRIERKFYANSGSGSFTGGNPILNV